MKSKRINEETPNGGDYSEIFNFDENGNPADEIEAKKCVIRECKADGTLVNELLGECNG